MREEDTFLIQKPKPSQQKPKPIDRSSRSRSHLDDLGVVASHGVVENRLPAAVGDVHPRVALEQLQQAGHVAPTARQVQRGAAILTGIGVVHAAAREEKRSQPPRKPIPK